MKKEILIILIILSIPLIYAWDDCRFNIENCTYPGSCGLYIDTDEDGICDHSETIPQKSTSTKSEAKVSNGYVFVSLSLILFIGYIITYFLSKKQIITSVLHKKIWNFFLLITFLAVALSGILLVLRINYGFNINWPFNMLYWHVETGIAMSLISIFHIIWHYPYFKSCIKKSS